MELAPKEIFEQLLKWFVVPTFDLVIEIENTGFVLVKRKIEPYKNQWALPGLRMYKGESINESVARIAKQEVGLNIDVSKKILIGQYVGKFKTENQRQDLSTGYYLKISKGATVSINPNHFSKCNITYSIPGNTGAMYKYYLEKAIDLR